jgi:hypothetical protein
MRGIARIDRVVGTGNRSGPKRVEIRVGNRLVHRSSLLGRGPHTRLDIPVGCPGRLTAWSCQDIGSEA